MNTKIMHAHEALEDALGCTECQAIYRSSVTRRPAVEHATKPVEHVVIGGAKSSAIKPRYDQIPALALRRLALRFSEGNKNYDPPEADVIGGPMNWQGGDATFFCQRLNHMIEHLNHWKECREKSIQSDDDDLAAVMWGCCVLMWAEENNKL